MTPDERTVYLDPERTLLVPRPGGRAASPPGATPQPAPPPAPQGTPPASPRPGSADTLQRLVAGLNPLIAAASELLALVPRLRATATHADRPGLRRQLLDRVVAFEERARASGVSKPQLTAARYLLCSFIDEVIAGTPWGAHPQVGVKGLLQEFHEEASGADKSFALLDRLSEDPKTNSELLELFYVCLALGFEGRYAGRADGRAELQSRMEHLLELTRPAAVSAAGPLPLAQHWAGHTAERAPALTVVPVWMALVVGAAVTVAVLLFFSTRLARQADGVMQQLHQVRSELRVERAARSGVPRLAPALQQLAQRGVLQVRDEAQRSLVTLGADGLFAAGTAELQPAAHDALAAVARALAAQRGRVEVIGHSDDRPLQSLRYPSNWHLSRERAQAVAQALVHSGLDAARVRAEGRADTEPLAPNTDDAARARNRRVEIELLLPRPE
ncbi:MAG: type VI secretion system protein TssL, long form [Burkholderiaceae bacterium]